MIEKRIATFTVIEALDVGETSAVYRACDSETGRTVALWPWATERLHDEPLANMLENLELVHETPETTFFVQPLVRVIGYWKGPCEPDEALPDPTGFIDPAWDPVIRSEVIGYLRTGEAPFTSAGTSECRLCGCTNGSEERSDGTFLWPEGLAHYLEFHDVRLPDEFVAHAAEGLRTELEVIPYFDCRWWKQVRV